MYVLYLGVERVLCRRFRDSIKTLSMLSSEHLHAETAFQSLLRYVRYAHHRKACRRGRYEQWRPLFLVQYKASLRVDNVGPGVKPRRLAFDDGKITSRTAARKSLCERLSRRPAKTASRRSAGLPHARLHHPIITDARHVIAASPVHSPRIFLHLHPPRDGFSSVSVSFCSRSSSCSACTNSAVVIPSPLRMVKKSFKQAFDTCARALRSGAARKSSLRILFSVSLSDIVKVNAVARLLLRCRAFTSGVCIKIYEPDQRLQYAAP